MANHHFAKLADVWKHLVLCEVLDLVRPEVYAESHAGSAWYELTPTAQRSYGVLHFLDRAGDSPALASSEYLRSLLELAEERPGRYPGSGVLAMVALGSRSDYVLCDRDPESAESLTAAATDLSLVERCRVVREDGPTAIWNAVAESDDPSRWLLHIDPFEPHESAGEGAPTPVELAQRSAELGAYVAYWYGFEKGESAFWAFDEIAPAAHTRTWCGALRYAEEDFDSPIIGCGVLVAPSEERIERRLDELGRAIEEIYADAPLPSGRTGSIAFESRTRGAAP